MNLPRQWTSFIGRERELAEVPHLLSQAHLVTLTGAGGVGKTRLALAVAEHLGTRFADGVAFVDLAPVIDPEAVPAAIARTLGVRDDAEHRSSSAWKTRCATANCCSSSTTSSRSWRQPHCCRSYCRPFL